MGFRELRLEKGLGPGGSGLAPFNFQGAGAGAVYFRDCGLALGLRLQVLMC